MPSPLTVALLLRYHDAPALWGWDGDAMGWREMDPCVMVLSNLHSVQVRNLGVTEAFPTISCWSLKGKILFIDFKARREYSALFWPPLQHRPENFIEWFLQQEQSAVISYCVNSPPARCKKAVISTKGCHQEGGPVRQVLKAMKVLN